MKRIKSVVAGMGILALSLGACVPSANESSIKVEETVVKSQNVSKDTEERNPEVDKKELKTVSVIQLMEHTSLNIIYDAFLEEMESLGYKDGETINIDFKNAQGEMSNIGTIIQAVEGENPEVAVAITTPIAQSAMQLTNKGIPVVFSAVTDPIAAGIVTDFDKTDKGMTGTSDIIQVDKILDLAFEITPDIKKIGYIYNAGEDNSVSNLAKLEAYASEHNFEVFKSAITSSTELQPAAASLISKVDAIFVANDNTVAEAMPILMTEANNAKVPVYVGADSMVMDGGFATVGIDYEELGRETAKQVDEILRGKKVEDIPVKVFKDKLNLYVNIDTAKELGIEISDTIKNDEKYLEFIQISSENK